jgi:curved DNA-binding protein CbpA
MEDSKSKNYYEILEVPQDATSEEIHHGYVRAKNAYSQDSLALYSLMSKEECDNILEMIEEAYGIVSDPYKRKQYDQARGFNNEPKTRYQAGPVSGFPNENRPPSHTLNAEPQTTHENNMTKIVAKKRFSLDYIVNTEMEARIEQCTEFTGAFLKEIREYKNVDIIRMADMTKVSKTYLMHIEDENSEALPAGAYTRGFVYQYAKCLKLNPDLVATSYLYRIKKTI